MFVELAKDEFVHISHMCNGFNDDIVLSACLEGHLGRIWVLDRDKPEGAIVIAADFCYLLGSMNELGDDFVVTKLKEQCRNKVIVVEDFYWKNIIEKNFPDSFRKFNRHAMKCESHMFDIRKLNDFISRVYPEFKIKRIDESIYYLVLSDAFMADCCSYFSSWEEFSKFGIGYCVIQDGQIVSGASSYTYCNGSIEITIGTKMEYRNKGLALACASKLIFECIERNIYPKWVAANPQSVALAEKLGYVFDKEYEVYFI